MVVGLGVGILVDLVAAQISAGEIHHAAFVIVIVVVVVFLVVNIAVRGVVSGPALALGSRGGGHVRRPPPIGPLPEEVDRPVAGRPLHRRRRRRRWCAPTAASTTATITATAALLLLLLLLLRRRQSQLLAKLPPGPAPSHLGLGLASDHRFVEGGLVVARLRRLLVGPDRGGGGAPGGGGLRQRRKPLGAVHRAPAAARGCTIVPSAASGGGAGRRSRGRGRPRPRPEALVRCVIVAVVVVSGHARSACLLACMQIR